MENDSKDIFWTRAFNYGCSFWSLFNLCHRHNGESSKNEASNHDEKSCNKSDGSSHPSQPLNEPLCNSAASVLTRQPNASRNHLGHYVFNTYDPSSVTETILKTDIRKSCINVPFGNYVSNNNDIIMALDESDISNARLSDGPKQQELKDGKYFLELLDSQQLELEKCCSRVKLYLDEVSTVQDYEEAGGLMRSAVGKANLLIKKRFQQFRELCELNIDQNIMHQHATNEDLMGYWDMAQIQIKEVKEMFKQIEQAKANKWKCSNDDQDFKSPIKPHKVQGLRLARELHTPSKSRDEARKKLLAIKEAGRLKMKEDVSNTVIIFCSNEKNKEYFVNTNLPEPQLSFTM